MHWVLQANIFNEEGYQRLLDTLDRLGLPYTTHKVIPFVGVLSPPLEQGEYAGDFDEHTDFELPPGPKIVIGSYSMANYARKKGWTPGSFDNADLDYERQLPYWGDRMFNSDALVCRFADVPRRRDEFFIRPTLDSKSFAGTVMGGSVFRRWQEKVLTQGADNGGTLCADTLVMVCPKKVILR